MVSPASPITNAEPPGAGPPGTTRSPAPRSRSTPRGPRARSPAAARPGRAACRSSCWSAPGTARRACAGPAEEAVGAGDRLLLVDEHAVHVHQPGVDLASGHDPTAYAASLRPRSAAPIASSSGSHVVGLVTYARSEGLGVQRMVSGTGRRTVAVAGCAGLRRGGAVIASRATIRAPCGAPGGLARAADGVNLERTAVPGDRRAGDHQPSKKALDVDGLLAPVEAVRERRRHPEPAQAARRRRQRRLVHARSGCRKKVTVTLSSVPSAGYLYGVLEVIGLPTDLDKLKGVVPGYRLLSALRYNAGDGEARQGRGGKGRRQGLREAPDASRDATRATRSRRSAARSCSRAARDRTAGQGRPRPARQERRARPRLGRAACRPAPTRLPSRSFRRARRSTTVKKTIRVRR